MATELDITELRLGLPGEVINTSSLEKSEKKRVFNKEMESDRSSSNVKDDGTHKCRNKNQVVGWPPVCAYRRKNNNNNNYNRQGSKKMYVKVSMDGAPFLRKVDLSSHKDYSEFVMNLEKLFDFYGICEAWKDAKSSSEYIPIYQDKDGDWMLLGDVPWQMFCESCKRLRIMKRSDAKVIGLRTKDFLKRINVQR
ncbi:Auxin-responsive protein IAA19 [Capsicum annuum]|uniref:auxin-induced protein 22C n=1 Tax=Capsicum annuum TaxID=4072 RepID=UPI0007BEBF55|nr:auxin-induced protein 22C [Capsicum annuum]KAF3653680.1 Auxin-responsive protein IAA19 [Capsicum annuum]